MDGEQLYEMYQKELAAMGVATDDFNDLDAGTQTAWHCVAIKLQLIPQEPK